MDSPTDSSDRNTRADGCAPYRPICVLDCLEANAGRLGGATAYRHLPDSAGGPPGTLSWTELDRLVGRVAAMLLRTGLTPGDRVLLSFPSGLDFIAAFLGCLRAGLIAVPVAPPRARDTGRWCAVHRDAAAGAVLTDASLFGRLDRVCRDEDLGPCLCLVAADLPEALSPGLSAPSPDSVAFLQYTSGSTAAPKGVIVTHGMITANLEQIRAAFDHRPGDRILSWLPQSHDMGLMSSVLTPLWLGIEAAFMSPAAFLRDPLRFLRSVGELGATVIGGPNFAYQLCADRATPEAVAGIDLSGVRLAFNGAERVEAATAAAFARAFAPCGFDPGAMAGCYGMAEATVCVSVATPGRGPVQDPAGGIADSGLPAPGVAVAIVDPQTLRRLPEGQTGEVWIRGANVAPGYWRNPQATAEVFGHELDGKRDWMRSGDLGMLRAGRLLVTGRIKELIVIRGQNHHPQDIEASIATAHSGIAPDRVAAFELSGSGLGIACELTREALRSGDTEEVAVAVRRAVTERHGIAPLRVEILRPAALPLTPSGKIRRLACREGIADALLSWRAGEAKVPAPAAAGLPERLAAMPVPLRRAHMLARLREQLAAVAGHTDPIAETERFFDLGLDSASGVALVAALERETGLCIEPAVIYEYPTPALLADHLLERLFAPSAAPVSDDIAALHALLASGPGR